MLTVAANNVVRVPNPCFAGQPFTIKIPVRFPDSMTVQYAWYKNDTLIEDSHKLLLGEKAIFYTIPANLAYGDSAAFHFKYRLDDGFDEWTSSPKYILKFFPLCAIDSVGEVDGIDVVVDPTPYDTCALTVGKVTSNDVPAEPAPTPYATCTLTVGSIEGNSITITNPTPHTTCTLAVGSINGNSMTIANPTPHTTCTIAAGTITSSDIPVEPAPIPHAACALTVGTVTGSDVAAANPLPYATCSITVGSIMGSDVAITEPVPHIIP